MKGTPSRHYTFIFNMFVMTQLANFLNCRKLEDEFNIFKGVLSSHIFIAICILIFFLQAILVTHGGFALNCYSFGTGSGGGLFMEQWLICIGFALIS